MKLPLLNDKARAALRAILDAWFPLLVMLGIVNLEDFKQAAVTGFLGLVWTFLFLVWPSREQIDAEKARRAEERRLRSH